MPSSSTRTPFSLLDVNLAPSEGGSEGKLTIRIHYEPEAAEYDTVRTWVEARVKPFLHELREVRGFSSREELDAHREGLRSTMTEPEENWPEEVRERFDARKGRHPFGAPVEFWQASGPTLQEIEQTVYLENMAYLTPAEETPNVYVFEEHVHLHAATWGLIEYLKALQESEEDVEYVVQEVMKTIESLSFYWA